MTKQTRIRRTPGKNKRGERYPASALISHPLEAETEGMRHGRSEPMQEQLPSQQAEQLHGLHLPSIQRQAMALEIARMQGNRSLNGLIHSSPGQEWPSGTEVLQRQNATKTDGTNPGGGGPGKIQNGKEQPYDVTGATLTQIAPQLAKFDGFASQTYAAISIQGEVTPKRRKDGKYQVRVQWIIAEITVDLPRWADYDAACPASQQEWDRFMRQARRHEQSAHVDAAHNLMKNLPAVDKIIIGVDVAEVQTNLQAKQAELGERLQKFHDGCDHGKAIDAFLYPERGSC